MRAPFSRTMFELLEEQAARNPLATVAISNGIEVTYAELCDRSRRVASAMQARGIRRADRVGILAANRIEWLEVFFAAAALGAIVVPISTWSKRNELDFLLEDSGIRCLFLVEAFGGQSFADDLVALRSEGRHSRLEHLVLIDGAARTAFEAYESFQSQAPLVPLAPGLGASAIDTLVILYTSGSSNRPKAVPLAHAAAIENAFNIGERQGLTPDDKVLVAVPLFWSYGAINALPAILTHGSTMVLQSRFEAGEALDLIERHRCTALYTLPAMTNALVAHPKFQPERTRTLRKGVTIGTAQDVRKAAETLGVQDICNIYGSTETYGNCCVTPSSWPLQQRANCQGPPLPGVSVRIRHPETNVPLPQGETGAVEVKGYLMQGYVGDSARNNSAAMTDDGWFRTGDLGSMDDDGNFHFAGRHSDMIKRSGINVSPAEVEEVLQQHPDIGLAGVTGVPDDAKGEAIVAYVVPRPGAALTPAAVIAHCRTRISGYKVPDIVHLAEALPLTSTGKLLRRELKVIAERQAGARK